MEERPLIQHKVIDGLLLRDMLIAGANLLEQNREAVDALNVFPVPDGDTGTNMSLTMQSAVREINAKEYLRADEAAAANIEPLEQVIDNLTMAIKANHVKRLQKGVCTIETGFVLVDLLTNYERVSDHCSNIAVIMIETAHNAFDTHKYLSKVRFSNQNFIDHYEHFNAKYSISE
jgi:hypothetical protein